MGPKDADGMANSIDPDQTLGAVGSRFTLFAQACLYENFSELKKKPALFSSPTSSTSRRRDGKITPRNGQVWGLEIP